jgi:hypothetical protein
MQQILEILASMNVKLESWGEKSQAEWEAFLAEMKAIIKPIRPESDETTACNEATETKPDPGMMQSTEEHQEIPREKPQWCRSENRGSSVGSTIWLQSAARGGRKEIVEPGGTRLPPAGSCPAMQKWHGEKGNSSGRFGSRKTVDRGMNWPSPAKR